MGRASSGWRGGRDRDAGVQAAASESFRPLSLTGSPASLVCHITRGCRMSQGIMALIKKPADWTAHPDYDAIHVESAPLV